MGHGIVFYRTEDGRCPVEEFLNSLPSKDAQKVAWVLRLKQDLDRTPAQYFKKLGGNEEIWECRVRLGSNTCRIFAFFDYTGTLILTHGYSKKSWKTDPRQIRQAEAHRRDHLERKGN
jgi:phage-related protein